MKLYHQKRDFNHTPEPEGGEKTGSGRPIFVVQKHRASHLHYDFRLEIDGVLKSWAIPKGPSLEPKDKRLAVHVEDHPIEYAGFEGQIPEGQYGAGTVLIWDRGTWEESPEYGESDYSKGMLKFRLHGERLKGEWTLIRMNPKPGEKGDNWLLIKHRDADALPKKQGDILAKYMTSAVSGRTLDEIAAMPVFSKRSIKNRISRKRLKNVPGAVEAEFPDKVAVQLATLADSCPTGDRWLHEIKFDGYRLTAALNDQSITLRTRNHHDWTTKFQEIATALRNLAEQSIVLDGEIVAFDDEGVSNFQMLQSTFQNGTTGTLVYQVFDLLFLNGFDLRGCALSERKELLSEILTGLASTRIQYTDHLIGNGPAFLQEVCQRGLEGIISKKHNSPYREGRCDSWLKSKCVNREEFVICGFTPPKNSRLGFGSLILGSKKGNKLQYVGKVGTGFTDSSLMDLFRRLKTLITAKTDFKGVPRSVAKTATWVDPQLIAEVQYSELTSEGILRHPSFLGLREDLIPLPAIQEKTMPSTKQIAVDLLDDDKLSQLTNVRMTHPDRVLYPDVGLTKLNLATYLVQVWDWVEVHLQDRPVSLYRCPEGIASECFFQRHYSDEMPDGIAGAEVGSEEPMLQIKSLEGFAGLAQMSVLEFHLWTSRIDRIDRPDRIVFDLDPHESLPWSTVVTSALTVRQFLEELGLTTFAMTTGGKGIHIVVPVERRQDQIVAMAFSKATADTLAASRPDSLTSRQSKASRHGKVYIDYLRNSPGATAIAPYSPRARSGAPVAVPISWDELLEIDGADHFSIQTVPQRLASVEDPWRAMKSIRQSITAKMRKRLKIN